MRTVHYTKAFRTDVKRAKRQHKDLSNLKKAITALSYDEKLDRNWRDHPLRGSCKWRRELHLEPDFLLVYRLGEDELFLERMGSHADLFE